MSKSNYIIILICFFGVMFSGCSPEKNSIGIGDGNEIQNVNVGNNNTINNTTINSGEKYIDKDIEFTMDFGNREDGYYFAIYDSIPCWSVDTVTCFMRNINDVAVSIDRISVNVISFIPQTLERYVFTHGAGEAAVQYYYGKIKAHKDLYPLYYQGEENTNIEEDQGKYLKIESNSMEVCNLNMVFDQPGIYELNIQIDSIPSNKYNSKIFKIYIPPENLNEVKVNYLWLLKYELLANRIKDYCNAGRPLPDIYQRGLKEAVNAQNRDGNYGLLTDMNTERWIASHYYAYNENTKTLDLKDFIEIYKSISLPEENISKAEIDDLLKNFYSSVDNWNMPWELDNNSGSFIVPQKDLLDLEPYAMITEYHTSENIESYIHGFVYNTQKGYKEFSGIIVDSHLVDINYYELHEE